MLAGAVTLSLPHATTMPIPSNAVASFNACFCIGLPRLWWAGEEQVVPSGNRPRLLLRAFECIQASLERFHHPSWVPIGVREPSSCSRTQAMRMLLARRNGLTTTLCGAILLGV